MSRRLVIGLIILFLILFGTTLFFYLKKGSYSNDPGEVKVAASIFPLYDLMKHVAGDKAEVVLILPPGTSPHTFEPTPKDQEELAGVDIVFAVGHGLDRWAVNLAGATSANTKVVIVDNKIELLESAEEDSQDLYDPHYWLSVTNAMIIVDNITDELVEIDSTNADYYIGNAFRYKKELEILRKNSLSGLSSIKTNKIITFHEAFGYFAQDLGLEVVATIEEFPGKEPTIQYITEVREIMEEYNIKILFREPQFSDSVILALSEDTGAEIYTLDPEGGGVEGVDSYIELIEYNVTTVREALD